MHYIDLEKLRPQIRELLTDLTAAQEALDACVTAVERRDVIKKHRASWVACREKMALLSHDKCWYIECKNSGTDDDVDHFRPKLSVDEAPNHPGYYWLAFDWKNFRLSCHRANRLRTDSSTGVTGGKSDHFPLIVEQSRASGPSEDVRMEQPALLDPTVMADVALLTCKPTGEVDLLPDRKKSDVLATRFDLSRKYLHLNWPTFVEERLTLYNKIERLIERAALVAPQNHGSQVYTDEFENTLRDIKTLMDPSQADSEYTMAARAYVRLYNQYWWVSDILLKV